jgi:membrane protein implicated in regulation of membrane protease activity
MAWWLWVMGGLALLVLELVTPGGLFALFFGAGALCVAGLAALGAGSVVQWITFPVLSVILLVALRARLRERLRPRGGPPVDSLIGQEVVLAKALPAGGEGQVELRGVPWSARAASGEAMAAGQRCQVERVEGVVLYVKAV